MFASRILYCTCCLISTLSVGSLRTAEPQPGGDLGRALTPLFDAVGDRNFTISSKDCVRGISPSFPVALRRLRGKLALMEQNPECDLRITVLGNSMTAGHGFAGDEKHPNIGGDQRRYSNRLEYLLREARWPNVVVDNQGVIGGGTTRDRLLRPFSRGTLTMTDIFIVDYAISDAAPCCGWGSDDQVRSETERLISFLLQLPGSPAVVYLETFTSKEGTNGGYDCHRPDTEFPHYPVLRKAMIPTVSYYRSVCRTLDSDPNWGSNGNPHPKPEPTHENIGRLLAGYFLTDMQSAFPEFVKDQDHESLVVVDKDPRLACAVKPAFRLYADSDGAQGFPATTDAWSFYEDMPGRPGWIAPVGRTVDITFQVQVDKGKKLDLYIMVIVGHTKDFGAADCWLDDGAQNTTIDGWSSNPKSYYQDVQVGSALNGGTHLLHCSNKGHKFKIVGLTGCHHSVR